MGVDMVGRDNDGGSGKRSRNMDGVDARGDDVFARVRLNKVKELTPHYVGRAIGRMTKKLGRNIGARTLHAMEDTIRELHGLGLNTEQAGEVLVMLNKVYHERDVARAEAKTFRAEFEKASVLLRSLGQTVKAPAASPLREAASEMLERYYDPSLPPADDDDEGEDT